MTLRDKLREDLRCYSRQNEDTRTVLNAHFFSAYRDTFVLKLPIGQNAASFGIIFLGSGVRNADTLRHEYGHRVQYLRMGFWTFLFKVAIPSVTANVLDRMNRLPLNYFGSPWEAEADRLGGVAQRAQPWPEGTYQRTRDLARLFFRHKKANQDSLP